MIDCRDQVVKVVCEGIVIVDQQCSNQFHATPDRWCLPGDPEGFRFSGTVGSRNHIEPEQATFDRTVVKRGFAGFFQPEQFGNGKIGSEQENGPARKALFQCGSQFLVKPGGPFIRLQMTIAAHADSFAIWRVGQKNSGLFDRRADFLCLDLVKRDFKWDTGIIKIVSCHFQHVT